MYIHDQIDERISLFALGGSLGELVRNMAESRMQGARTRKIVLDMTSTHMDIWIWNEYKARETRRAKVIN